jgi:hypothetical protein
MIAAHLIDAALSASASEINGQALTNTIAPEQKQLREEVLMNLGSQKFPADLSKGCARNFHCSDYGDESPRSRYEQ